ncbi:MAG: CoA transferase [Chloroflexi bacterium]|nr:CoA transferase [Chloroflexota bacterium]
MAIGPLSGYRVLDMANELGVYGTKLMADLGAEVIKIEPPTGDATRRLPPFFKDQVGAEYSLFYAYMNTNKQSITLNLDEPEGQALFRELVKQTDVVYETFEPGYLSERGIRYEQLQEMAPYLVWVAVTPFGQTGPHRDWKGSNLVGWATSGVLYMTGDLDRPPVVPGGSALLAYILAAINGAIGALLALRARTRQGRGQLVDISVQEAALGSAHENGLPVFLDDLLPRGRSGNRRLSTRPFGLYPTKDGYAAVLTQRPSHWDAYAEWVKEKTGVEGIVDSIWHSGRQRNQFQDLMDEWCESLTTQYNKQDLFEEAQRRGATITPVNTVADLVADPNMVARDYWTEVEHPALGLLRMAGAPYRLSETPWQAGRAPLLGEHNEAVYCGKLGLKPTELAALRAKGVV